MRRIGIRLLIALAGLAVLAGLALSATFLSPERLRSAAESQLSAWTRHPVSVGKVELAIGVGIQLRGEDLELWPLSDGPALRVARIGVGLEPFSLLMGKLRPRRIRLEGATLTVTQDEEGKLSPPFERRPGEEQEEDPPPPKELLAPLIVLENIFRFLLEQPRLSDLIQASQSQVQIELRGSRPGAPPRRFSLTIEEGELRHRRLLGDARLELQGDLSNRTGTLGELAIEARRDPGNELEIDLDFAGLELPALEEYLPERPSGSGLGGRAEGQLAFRSSAPGEATLDVDLALHDLEARALEETPWGPLQAARTDLKGQWAIEPGRIELRDGRLASGELRVELAGGFDRPLAPGSRTGLDFTFREMEISRVRALLHWLATYAPAKALEALIAPVVSGRLHHLTARAQGRLSEWQALFAGEASELPLAASAEAELTELVLEVGDGDRLEGVSGRAFWSGDRLELQEVTGAFNGEPLPVLDLGFDGLSHLLAAQPERRVLRGGAPALPGLPALRESFAGPEDAAAGSPVKFDLEIDWLHHPISLWPLEQARVRIESAPDALRLEIHRGSWGGVPVRGQGTWSFEPERRLAAELQAEAPDPTATGGAAGRPWAQGRFTMGPVESRRWHQLGAQGRFQTLGGTLRLRDLSVDLEPAGTVTGSLSLDLSEADEVPFALSAVLEGGDVDTLIRQIGANEEVATGRVQAWGSFEGRLRPGSSPFAGLNGLLEIAAGEGRIRRSLPPIVAVALASRSFNPFVERESIRYRQATALAEFREGRVRSRELSVDGPDMRVVASGEIGLVDRDHPIDAEVALFLFRPIDKAVGTIPVLNLMLLGADQNLMAAYFKLKGPWEDPKPKLVPLKSLTAGPGSLVLEGVPGVVGRGLRALGALLEGEEEPEQPESGPGPQPWQQTPRGS